MEKQKMYYIKSGNGYLIDWSGMMTSAFSERLTMTEASAVHVALTMRVKGISVEIILDPGYWDYCK
jgi:hypothetical protein